MTEEFMTILIPTYNRVKLLQEALRSALNQNYDNFEVVVCDNCSTDETEEMMKKYLNNPHVKYVRHDQNIGITLNWYHGLNQFTQGNWYLLLCDDDFLIDVDFLKKCNELIQECPTLKIIHGNVLVKDELRGRLYPTQGNYPKVMKGTDYFIHYWQTNRGLHTPLVLIEKETAVRCGAYTKDIYGIDQVIGLRVLLEGDLGFINEPFAGYRYHESNATWIKISLDKTMSLLEEIYDIYELAKSKDVFSTTELEKWRDSVMYNFYNGAYLNQVHNEQVEAYHDKVRSRYPFIKLRE